MIRKEKNPLKNIRKPEFKDTLVYVTLDDLVTGQDMSVQQRFCMSFDLYWTRAFTWKL